MLNTIWKNRYVLTSEKSRRSKYIHTVQIREVWPGRPGYQGLVWCVLMADTVVRHCSSPIAIIVYNKYFAKTNTVIGEEQCCTTQSAIKTHLTRPWTLPYRTKPHVYVQYSGNGHYPLSGCRLLHIYFYIFFTYFLRK